MYLIDTNVISEVRKGRKADSGVRAFFNDRLRDSHPVYISAITVGELRRGIEKIKHRNDKKQAHQLERWLKALLEQYADHILDFDQQAAQIWGRLRVPNYENALDKQIAATALIHDLVVVTRNTEDFISCGVELYNPFYGKGSVE